MKMGALRLTRNLQLGQGARPYQDVTGDFTSSRDLAIIRNKKASVRTARKPSFETTRSSCSQFVVPLASFRNSSINGWPMRLAASL
jgi:hypothetical protein